MYSFTLVLPPPTTPDTTTTDSVSSATPVTTGTTPVTSGTAQPPSGEIECCLRFYPHMSPLLLPSPLRCSPYFSWCHRWCCCCYGSSCANSTDGAVDCWFSDIS